MKFKETYINLFRQLFEFSSCNNHPKLRPIVMVYCSSHLLIFYGLWFFIISLNIILSIRPFLNVKFRLFKFPANKINSVASFDKFLSRTEPAFAGLRCQCVHGFPCLAHVLHALVVLDRTHTLLLAHTSFIRSWNSPLSCYYLHTRPSCPRGTRRGLVITCTPVLHALVALSVALAASSSVGNRHCYYQQRIRTQNSSGICFGLNTHSAM